MSPQDSLALVISTFNQPDYLARVLTAVAGQSRTPREVVLADDGSEPDTRALFGAWAQGRPHPCDHVWQEHQGFRRAQILNRAIARTRSTYLVFLDGDTVPHPRFVDDHARVARARCFVQGHRALIEQRAAPQFGRGDFAGDRWRALLRGQLRSWKHAYRWPFPVRRVRTDLRGIRGCNLGVWRADLVAVNGYNEAFVGWGREDSELAVRLFHAGIRRLDVRGRALCYHLWHPPANRQCVAANDRLLAEAQAMGLVRCAQGLDQHGAASA